jgi:hypothetical protein
MDRIPGGINGANSNHVLEEVACTCEVQLHLSVEEGVKGLAASDHRKSSVLSIWYKRGIFVGTSIVD